MSALSGMKEICRYFNRSESTVMDRINHENFPAAKIGGGWESDTELIDDWRKGVVVEKIKEKTGKRKKGRGKRLK